MGLFKMFSSAPAPLDDDASLQSYEVVQSPAPVHQPPSLDAVDVLQQAGVDDEQRARVSKAQELLHSLPAGTPDELKRNIVEASLKAFDVSIDAIVAAANAELQAYEAFISEGNEQTTRELEEGAREVERLEAEIADIKRRMELARSDQESLDAETRDEIERVRPVRDFFVQPAATVTPDNDVEVDMGDETNEGPSTVIIDETLGSDSEATG